MLRTLKEPPEKDSPREVALTYFIIRLEDIDHSKIRAIAQLILNPEKGKETFDEYMKTAFPYLVTAMLRDKDALQKQLMEEVKRGPMEVKQLERPMDKKGNKARVISRAQYAAEQAGQSSTRPPEEMSRIYSRLRKNN